MCNCTCYFHVIVHVTQKLTHVKQGNLTCNFVVMLYVIQDDTCLSCMSLRNTCKLYVKYYVNICVIDNVIYVVIYL